MPENILSNSTYLYNPMTDGVPNAALFVTQNHNLGGGCGMYDNHPIGVCYDANVEE